MLATGVLAVLLTGLFPLLLLGVLALLLPFDLPALAAVGFLGFLSLVLLLLSSASSASKSTCDAGQLLFNRNSAGQTGKQGVTTEHWVRQGGKAVHARACGHQMLGCCVLCLCADSCLCMQTVVLV
jgi:hypothetical protein